MNEGVPRYDSDFLYKERAFYRTLDSLPAELATAWRDKFEALDEVTEDFYRDFEQYCTLREQALDKNLELDEDLSEEVKMEIEMVKKVVRDTFGDPNQFLGNGYTAEVYSLPIAPHLCVKYIHDQNAYNENNHIRTEHDFLVELRNFRVAGVRTPVPYFVRIHPSEGHSYGMERIQGKSLAQILERPADNLELIALLKTLDREEIKQSLQSYVVAMHETFKITHGDLFQRNLMVDDSGNFYVIDFGKAKREEVGEDHEARRKADIATMHSEIGTFFNSIDKLEIN